MFRMPIYSDASAGEGKRELANSTYYIGLDLGITLDPVLGGMIFGNLPLPGFIQLRYLLLFVIFNIFFKT